MLKANLKKDAAENLHRIETELAQNRQLSVKIEELEGESENKSLTLKTQCDKLRINNEKLCTEVEASNCKIIQHEIRQKEQQETITKLFRVNTPLF